LLTEERCNSFHFHGITPAVVVSLNNYIVRARNLFMNSLRLFMNLCSSTKCVSFRQKYLTQFSIILIFWLYFYSKFAVGASRACHGSSNRRDMLRTSAALNRRTCCARPSPRAIMRYFQTGATDMRSQKCRLAWQGGLLARAISRFRYRICPQASIFAG
jgi:hypothetical protein